MVYKVIGLMSGSSLDGLDMAYVHLQERAGKWEYEFVHTECRPYPDPWKDRLATASALSALEYQLLHSEYGHWLGGQVLDLIAGQDLAYQVQLIVSHGHTSFHLPARRMTAQLGDGAAIAAVTGINTVSDLRAMDLALGGQGAPIVPGGERLLFPGYALFLNLGGIANISGRTAAGKPAHGSPGPGDAEKGPIAPGPGDAEKRPIAPTPGGAFTAFDVCPANRVLDLLAALEGRSFDEGGSLAATGRVDGVLLRRLNALPYYGQGYPKSLANDFGTNTVFPMIRAGVLSTADALRTYVEHIAMQVAHAVALLQPPVEDTPPGGHPPALPALPLLLTGGGAHNSFLLGRLRELLQPLRVEIIVPDDRLIDYKEALVMALLGVLRWREENNVLASVTGARRDSIGGAVWIGQEI